MDALIGSFAAEPEVHQPVRGRVKGTDAFARFVTETRAWLAERNASVEDVDILFTGPPGALTRNLHLDGDPGRSDLPVTIAPDHAADGARIVELRFYLSSCRCTGGLSNRPPLLQ